MSKVKWLMKVLTVLVILLFNKSAMVSDALFHLV